MSARPCRCCGQATEKSVVCSECWGLLSAHQHALIAALPKDQRALSLMKMVRAARG